MVPETHVKADCAKVEINAEVDFDGREIRGFSEYEIILQQQQQQKKDDLNPALVLKFNILRRSSVSAVTVNGIATAFEIVHSKISTLFPPKDKITAFSELFVPLKAGEASTQLNEEVQQESLSVRIQFSITECQDGLNFFPFKQDTSDSPSFLYTKMHFFPFLSVGDAADSAEQILPDIQLTLIVPVELPVLLGGSIGSVKELDAKQASMKDTLVVAPGELVRQVQLRSNPSKKLVQYEIPSDLYHKIDNIRLYIGGYDVYSFNCLSVPCFIFYLSQFSSLYMIEKQAMIIAKSVEFYTTYVGSSFPFPGNSYKFVYLPIEGQVDFVSLPTLSCVSLYGPYLLRDDLIDETMYIHTSISRLVSMQWFSEYIVPRTLSDMWVCIGISNYMSGLYLRKQFGGNEYKFRIRKDMERCFGLDINKPPLFVPPRDGVVWLSDEELEFMRLKAPIVVYMMEKYLGKNVMQKVLNRIMVSAISGELSQGITTHYFLKLVKKTSGKEIKPFADQWIYRSGVPHMDITYTLNRKKNLIELIVLQKDESRPVYAGGLTVRVHEPDGVFDHVVTVEERSHHFDLPYHTKYKRVKSNKKSQLAEMRAALEVAERERAIGLSAPAGTEYDEEMCKRDPEIVLELAKADWKPTDSEGAMLNPPINWIRLDPEMEILCCITFTQSDYMDSQQALKEKDVVAQYEAVRRMVNHTLSEVTNAMQAANTGKGASGGSKVAHVLFAVLMNVRAHYRVRMEAAISLAKGFSGEDAIPKPEIKDPLAAEATREIDSLAESTRNALYDGWPLGKKFLFMAFKKKFCVNPFEPSLEMVPRRNNFSAFTEYFVQKSLAESFAFVKNLKDSKASTITGNVDFDAMKLLVNLLKLNDNTNNKWSDHQYVSTLIDGIGSSFLEDQKDFMYDEFTDDQEAEARRGLFSEALQEVERHLFLETQVPSYRNSIAQTCLCVLYKWMAAGLIQTDLRPFFLFSRYGNFIEVRQVAVDGLVILGMDNHEFLSYCFQVLKSDPSVQFRRHVASRLACAFTMINDKLKQAKEITESGSTTPTKKLQMEVENLESGVIEQTSAIRKAQVSVFQKIKNSIVNDKNLYNSLQSIVSGDEDSDARIRLSILEMCECIFEDRQGPPTKLKIHLSTALLSQPPTPSKAVHIKIPKFVFKHEAASQPPSAAASEPRFNQITDARVPFIPEETQVEPVKEEITIVDNSTASVSTVQLEESTDSVQIEEPAVTAQPEEPKEPIKPRNIIKLRLNRPQEPLKRKRVPSDTEEWIEPAINGIQENHVPEGDTVELKLDAVPPQIVEPPKKLPKLKLKFGGLNLAQVQPKPAEVVDLTNTEETNN